MAETFHSQVPLAETARGLGQRQWLLLAAAMGCLVVAGFASNSKAQETAVIMGMTFLALFMVIRGLISLSNRLDRRFADSLNVLVKNDVTPCFTTDEFGQITFRNESAEKRFQADDGATLIATLHDHFADPASVLFRLQCRARNNGGAREDIVTRRGHTRLSVHCVDQNRFVWRLEEFVEKHGNGRGAESLSLPMLVASKSGTILFCNEAMRRLLGARPKRLDRIFNTDTLRSGEITEVVGADGMVRAILAEVTGAGDRREIYLLPVPESAGKSEVLADFEHIPVALIKFRADGSLRAANRAARDLIGIPPEDSSAIHDLFEGLGRPVNDWLVDVLAGRVPENTEVLRLSTTDDDVFLQVSLRRTVDQ